MRATSRFVRRRNADTFAGLEGYLLAVGLRDLLVSQGVPFEPPVVYWPIVPDGWWTGPRVDAARDLYRATLEARRATEGLRTASDASELSDRVRSLLGALFVAESGAARFRKE